jgi:hypothetical protein
MGYSPLYGIYIDRLNISITFISMQAEAAGGASTIRVKFQIAATNVLKLVELSRLSHVDFRSGFGTVLQDVRRVFTLSEDH